jgi:hypothetical protein
MVLPEGGVLPVHHRRRLESGASGGGGGGRASPDLLSVAPPSSRGSGPSGRASGSSASRGLVGRPSAPESEEEEADLSFIDMGPSAPKRRRGGSSRGANGKAKSQAHERGGRPMHGNGKQRRRRVDSDDSSYESSGEDSDLAGQMHNPPSPQRQSPAVGFAARRDAAGPAASASVTSRTTGTSHASATTGTQASRDAGPSRPSSSTSMSDADFIDSPTRGERVRGVNLHPSAHMWREFRRHQHERRVARRNATVRHCMGTDQTTWI